MESIKRVIKMRKSSGVTSGQEDAKLVACKPQEEVVKVTWRSYVKYIFYSKKNKFLFPLCIFFFLLTEATNILYFRFISQYDLMKSNAAGTTFQKMTDFWLALGLLLLCYFLFSTLKYFVLNVVVLNSNE